MSQVERHGFLLDTNVISEVRKPQGDTAVRRWLASQDDARLYLSVLVVGEIRRGIERLRRRDPRQADALNDWLGQLCRHHADRILPITEEIAHEWGRLNVPDPLPVVDGLLAATARIHDLTLVTRNTADTARTGVRIFNPFS